MRPEYLPPTPTGDVLADLAAAEAHELRIRHLAYRDGIDLTEDEYCELAAAAARAVDEAHLAVETADLERRLMEPLGDGYWRGLTVEEIDLAWELRPQDLCAQARRDPASVRLPISPEVVHGTIDTETARALLAILARPSTGGILSALGAVAREGVPEDRALIVRADPQVAALAGGQLVAVVGAAPAPGSSVQVDESGWALAGGTLRWRSPEALAALDRLRAAVPGPLLLRREDLGAIGVHPAKGYARLIWWAGSRRIELPVWGQGLERRLLDLMEVRGAGLVADIPEAALWLPATATLTTDRRRIRLSDTAGLGSRGRAPVSMLWSRTERGGDLSEPIDGPRVTVIDSIEAASGRQVERTTVLVAELPATIRFGSGASFELRADPPAGALDPAGAIGPGEARQGLGYRQEVIPEPRVMVRRGGGRLLPYGGVER